jgi:hypothetical protein
MSQIEATPPATPFPKECLHGIRLTGYCWQCDAEEGGANGRWVGEDLWWDIGKESISDSDLRVWVRQHLPEDSLFSRVGDCLVAYHFRAYANRRRAISEYMRTLKW